MGIDSIMNASSQSQQPLIIQGWTWGLNEEHSRQAVELAADAGQTIRMANDILEGRVNFAGYCDSSLIWCKLVGNAALPLEKARQLEKSTNDLWCLFELCSRPDATAELLDECAADACQYVVNAIVHHNNVKPETVAKITKNPVLEVVEVALTSSRLPEETLESFATSSIPEFRETVAFRSKRPQTISNLAFDNVPQVRAAAVGRDNIAMAILEIVALNDTDLEVAAIATKRLTNPEVLAKVYERLHVKYDESLAHAIMENKYAHEGIRVGATLLGSDSLKS